LPNIERRRRPSPCRRLGADRLCAGANNASSHIAETAAQDAPEMKRRQLAKVLLEEIDRTRTQMAFTEAIHNEASAKKTKANE